MDRQLQNALRSLKFWAADPIKPVLRPMAVPLDGGMTVKQYMAYSDRRPVCIILGGNQSGKTRTACARCISYALGLHPNSPPPGDVNIWFCTTSYDKFAEQAWTHFKSMLVFPGENVLDTLPTARILNIDWVKRSPETPRYLQIKRICGGVAHVYVHTFAQGRKEFQGQSVDLAVIDEECPDEIYDEIKARFLAKPKANVIVAATPIDNVLWLSNLCERYDDDQENGRIAKHMLPTWENPANSEEWIDDIKRGFKDSPEDIKLRLEGIAKNSSGLVYPERIFTKDHLIHREYVGDIQDRNRWTCYRCIDAGYRYPAAVWLAVRHDDKQIVLYRSWKGKNLTIAEASKKILALSGYEKYHYDLIDPEVQARCPETGKAEIEVWRANGVKAIPAWENKVQYGLNRAWQLMMERVEVAGPDGQSMMVPRFRVNQEDCVDWLEERRRYRHKETPIERHRNIKPFEIVKRDDHTLDPFRLLCSVELKFVPPSAPEYPYSDFVEARRIKTETMN